MLQPPCILSRAIAVVPGLILTPLLAFAQEPLQLNVPYRCQDGVTRTVNRCEKNPRGVEVCFWREEENGQASSERDNVRGQMDGWLRMCTAQAPNVVPAPRPATVAAPPAPRPQPPQPARGGRRAMLRPTGPVVSGAGIIGLMAALAGGQANPAAQQSDTTEAPAGPRMSGTYVGANGFQMEFQPTAVILDCGEAHVIRRTRRRTSPIASWSRYGTGPFRFR